MMLGLREGWVFVGRYCSESSFSRRLAGVERITPQLNSSGGQSAGPASIAERGSEAMLFALRSTFAVLLHSGLEPFQ